MALVDGKLPSCVCIGACLSKSDLRVISYNKTNSLRLLAETEDSEHSVLSDMSLLNDSKSTERILRNDICLTGKGGLHELSRQFTGKMVRLSTESSGHGWAYNNIIRLT